MARARNGVSRRRLLTGTAATAALFALPSSVRGQVPASARKIPMRSARDRLEEALARIADTKGEGARACLTVYSQTARGAADAAVLVVVVQRGGVPAPQPQRGLAFPGGGEPDRLGQLQMRNLDILDSRQKLAIYARAGVLPAGAGAAAGALAWALLHAEIATAIGRHADNRATRWWEKRM